MLQVSAQRAEEAAADQLHRTKTQAAADMATQQSELRREADIERGVADAAWAVTKVLPSFGNTAHACQAVPRVSA